MSDTFRKAYRPLGEQQSDAIEAVKAGAEQIEDALTKLKAVTPVTPEAGRQYALAMTNLEQAVMWAVKAITA